MEQALESARQAAVAELEEYGRWLREDLLARSNGNFRIGEEKYRTKLAFTLHSDLSMRKSC